MHLSNNFTQLSECYHYYYYYIKMQRQQLYFKQPLSYLPVIHFHLCFQRGLEYYHNSNPLK